MARPWTRACSRSVSRPAPLSRPATGSPRASPEVRVLVNNPLRLDHRDFYRGRRVLVTGGLGFIGSNLCRTLADLGARVVAVDSMLPDYGGNLHKWLCAPKGAGFLYARPEVQHLLKPLVVSWGYESETPSGSTFVDHHEWWGTRDIAAFLAVPKAIEFQAENHWDEVRDSCYRLVLDAQKRICELTGLAPLHPQTEGWFRQMVTAPLPADTALTLLKKRLYDDYRVEVPIIDWNGNKLIRVSVQGYNTRRDIDMLIHALSKLLY